MQITCLINLLSALPIDFPFQLNLQLSKNYFDHDDDVDDYGGENDDDHDDDDDDVDDYG